jgi:hypothetical protein
MTTFSPSPLMADHCVLDFRDDPTVLRCLHCGASAPYPLPVSISKAVLDSRAFSRQHRDCPPPEVEP